MYHEYISNKKLLKIRMNAMINKYRNRYCNNKHGHNIDIGKVISMGTIKTLYTV